MNCKTIFKRKSLFLLMAGAGLAAVLTGCGDDDEIKTVEKPRKELSAKLTLKNERGQETTTFKVGENIFFCLTLSYSCTPERYNYTTRVPHLFGLGHSDEGTVVITNGLIDLSADTGGKYREDEWATAMAVFTADGQFVGYPMDIIYDERQSIKPGDSIYYECPWLAVGAQTLYTSIFGKTTQHEPLPAGKYYTCNVTLNETALPVTVSYIKNRVDFTVE